MSPAERNDHHLLNHQYFSRLLTERVGQQPQAPAGEGGGDDDEPEEVGGEGDTSYEGDEGVRVEDRRTALAVAVRGGAEQSGPGGEEGGERAGHFDCYCQSWSE